MEEIETQLLTRILAKRPYETTFLNLINEFEAKFNYFNPLQNNFEILKYFERGEKTAKMLLKHDGLIDGSWLRSYKTKRGNIKMDFSGLYVFMNGNSPFYVGISKNVVGRVIQHLKGKSHHTSTLAYNIGLLRHELITGMPHTGTRNDFNFADGVEPEKQFLFKQRLAWIPIVSPEELYLFEIFCAMKMECWVNKFETH
jgi:hypothetical protein